MKKLSPQEAPWLFDADVQALLAVLSANGEEARIVGGAVRNALLAKPISDIDIATTSLPQETMRRAKEAGFHSVPTGIDFGTVTIVIHERPFEVTTLRADVETDGRHAVVVFGRDWKQDAQRRDFTINALYCDRMGQIYDDVGGLADIDSGTLRFIGVAQDRIREDYLRILRFFRFFAWYGSGRPDAEGLKASARLKDGLRQLSVERIWAELKKLLSAPDPSRALLWMRQTGVLTEILPESEKWGIDSIHALVETERASGWDFDPLLRLQSMLPPDPVRMKALGERLKFSNEEKKRLIKWADMAPLGLDTSDMVVKKALYHKGRRPVLDRLQLAFSGQRANALNDTAALIGAGQLAQLIELATHWPIPALPVNGQDLVNAGISAGPEVGKKLHALESLWIDSGFKADKKSLLQEL